MKSTANTGTLFILTVLGCLAAGCAERDGQGHACDVAVTNSYLACAVRDVCGPEVEILCLAPAGMCPGHFDISPAQVSQLRSCRMLLLFDFQQKVEEALARLKDNGLQTYLIQTPPGLCVPQTYLAACEQTAELFAREYPDRAAEFEQRLPAIRARLETLSKELKTAVADVDASGAEALTSNHQAKFCEWLGLEPVATFIGSDVETMANIDHCLKLAAGREIRFVIANQQEGTALAVALAERLEARAVVFSNFPSAEEGEGFDRLLRDNVRALTEAAAQ